MKKGFITPSYERCSGFYLEMWLWIADFEYTHHPLKVKEHK